MTDFIVVLTTTDREDLARRIADEAVQRQLAACVQIVGPLTSVYRWKGAVESAKEYRCEFKTTSDHFPALREMISDLHSYDVPEIVSLPISDCSSDYGSWLKEQLTGADSMHQPNEATSEPNQINASLLSIQVGMPQTYTDAGGEWTTGFFKMPIKSAPVRQTGLEGDGQADLQHHGGIDKAVLAYASSHYPDWESELSQQLPFGAFGENLTITEIDEANVCIGDQWKIGDAIFEVSQPRQPCWKLSRRWQNKLLPKLVIKSGRSGWYFRVLQCGSVQAGNTVELTKRPNPKWTIAKANEAFYGTDADNKKLLSDVQELSASWKQELIP